MILTDDGRFIVCRAVAPLKMPSDMRSMRHSGANVTCVKLVAPLNAFMSILVTEGGTSNRRKEVALQNAFASIMVRPEPGANVTSSRPVDS